MCCDKRYFLAIAFPRFNPTLSLFLPTYTSFVLSFIPSFPPSFLSFCIYVRLLILTGVSNVLIPTCLSALSVLYKGSLHSRILILKNSFKSTSYKIILFPLFSFMLRILFVSLYRSLYGIYIDPV